LYVFAGRVAGIRPAKRTHYRASVGVVKPAAERGAQPYSSLYEERPPHRGKYGAEIGPNRAYF
jgi:hypothetical protein